MRGVCCCEECAVVSEGWGEGCAVGRGELL